MRRLRLIILTALIAPTLSGCLAIGAAALVTGAAVGTAGTVVGTAGKVGGAAVGAILPGGDDDGDED